MADFRGVDDLDPAGKRVLVRVDLNVPMKDGAVTDAARIDAVIPTLGAIAAGGGRVIVMSHFGRPQGKRVSAMSLAPLAPLLAERLGRSVAFVGDCVGAEAEAAAAALGGGEVLLLENLRFHPGEEANDPAFAGALARLGDLYVDDAFSCAHRAHASTVAIAGLLPSAAGRALKNELDHLGRALESPRRPVAAIIGGAKVSTKLAVLANLCAKADMLAIGGGMANTFLHAAGKAVGASLCERDMADTVRGIAAAAAATGCDIVLPRDVVIAARPEPGIPHRVVAVEAVPDDAMILDIGPATADDLSRRLGACRTLVWNGPLGLFEVPPFDAGTLSVARAAAGLTARGGLLSVAGGGDTMAALAGAGVVDAFTYVSTAGGAFLEWLEGKTLPGIAALQR